MKKLLLPFAFVLIAACTPTTPEQPDNGIGAQKGEFCGGIAALQCAPGLECVYEGTYPDAGGTCE